MELSEKGAAGKNCVFHQCKAYSLNYASLVGWVQLSSYADLLAYRKPQEAQAHCLVHILQGGL